jgi:hypothetical protein
VPDVLIYWLTSEIGGSSPSASCERRAEMSEDGWLVQIYQMADENAQATAAGLLHGLASCSVDTRTCESGAFLVVGCDSAAALAVYELVIMADQEAELIHSTTGPASRTSTV